MPAIGCRAAALETLTMRPHSAEAMRGITSLAQRKAPVTFTSKTRRQSESSVWLTGRGTPGVPAVARRRATGGGGGGEGARGGGRGRGRGGGGPGGGGVVDEDGRGAEGRAGPLEGGGDGI